MSAGPTGRASSASGTRAVRYAALAIAVPFLLLVLAFVVMPFLDHSEARLDAVGPIAPAPGIERGGLVFAGTAGVWEVKGRVAVDAGRRVHLAFDLAAPNGQPAPATLVPGLLLDLADREIEPLRLEVSRTGPGAYASGAPVPFGGRWRLRIEFPDITGVFVFDVAD